VPYPSARYVKMARKIVNTDQTYRIKARTKTIQGTLGVDDHANMNMEIGKQIAAGRARKSLASCPRRATCW